MARNVASPRRSDKHIAALVLAAGESRRMGDANKLTIPVDGTPMVARVVDALQQSRAQRVIVITGHEPERIKEALSGRDVEFVHNPDYAEGIGSSVRMGITALDDDADGALVALGDMPWVNTEVINRLVDAFTTDRELSIFIPMFGGKRGNPVLWGSQHFPELLALSGDVGGKALFDRHATAICYVNVESASVNTDVDTPDALQKLGIQGDGEPTD
jgi:molybdenum cofactor cytidylyltransferase